ncbi:redoxin domain-containing protein [Duganella sp. FT80W]|uniref:Redoxin domain-containing protein n=1 Tax=Duganella guangzhouensis TaxID=2666084 RepID=A0A6I2KTZ8_9BURK|nr:redoxin domain-containing protein [Duganella guangzhouensis]MRW89233.1 redoxin domain-containing protein [Duganella guangzhouensis]
MTTVYFILGFFALVLLVMMVVLVALARQIGVLFERIAPVGAMVNDSGPKIGELAPSFRLDSLTGGSIQVGAAGSGSTLLFFLSPSCPVCKQLIPVLKDIDSSERAWLRVQLASDGSAAPHRQFIEQQQLQAFPYVLSEQLGVTYRVARLPFAVLLDADGVVRAKGLVNNREQLESLFNAVETGHASIQAYAQYQSAHS